MSLSTCGPRRKWLHILKLAFEEANGDAAFIAKALGDIIVGLILMPRTPVHWFDWKDLPAMAVNPSRSLSPS